jgi:hypothetical protein
LYWAALLPACCSVVPSVENSTSPVSRVLPLLGLVEVDEVLFQPGRILEARGPAGENFDSAETVVTE